MLVRFRVELSANLRQTKDARIFDYEMDDHETVFKLLTRLGYTPEEQKYILVSADGILLDKSQVVGHARNIFLSLPAGGG